MQYGHACKLIELGVTSMLYCRTASWHWMCAPTVGWHLHYFVPNIQARDTTSHEIRRVRLDRTENACTVSQHFTTPCPGL